MPSGFDITSGPHNDFVGGDASKGRIPGAEKATSGHFFVSVDPSPGQMRHEQRAEEHLPPPTGRDAPPAGDVAPCSRTRVAASGRESFRASTRGAEVDPDVVAFVDLPSEILRTRENAPRKPSPLRQVNLTPSALPPAVDSCTVVDRDPYEQPAGADDTLGGATSADVNKGLGRPPVGMSSAEMHHDGKSHRKRQMGGVEQYGSGEIPRETETE
ncbi:hypothetical protein GSI_10809 [Ganoderma sinense ZZ0214-1]|uniref:Uncharacterized protein n=1 Tax=Ganoderma sinense ZZ0214-1 TaxID=1077348 RepID=A0A2G8S1P3_9APHY|nr:hypothetical protein GSI_10809 [Ganoderma sinense ZZ0214-1]